MKRYLILTVLFFIVLNIQSQEKEKNKEAIKSSGTLIDFLMKYDKEAIEGEVKQSDFDKMAKDMGLNTDTSNGLTKEDAFKFTELYIKSDRGENIQIDDHKEDEVANYFNDIEKQKSDALAIFKEATTDVKLNQMMANAEKELYDAGMFREDVWYPYKEYKARVLRDYPDANEGQIKAAYKYFLKQIKIGMGIEK
ncbi:hypothetical protein [Lutibacter sp.]